VKIAALLLALLLASVPSVAVTHKTGVRKPKVKPKSKAKSRSTHRHATVRRTHSVVSQYSHHHRRAVPVRHAVYISPALRATAEAEIARVMEPVPGHLENASALVPFFEELYRAQQDGHPVHILQYGDSHTASDDWVNAMREAFQAKFGSGGPGFCFAGHPYLGYRRFDVSGSNSSGWHTDGTVARLNSGDGRYGLGGVSLTAESPGQTVNLTAASDELQLLYLQQPGGGSLQFAVDGVTEETVSTAGDLGPGKFRYTPSPGQHRYTLTTLSSAPVRLFGWVAQNHSGVTFETMGINGAQAYMMLDWDEAIWSAELADRDPALIVLAYGTNEAISRKWNAEDYRIELHRVIDRLRHASPTTSILLVGPPDCLFHSRSPMPGNLDEITEIQREIASETGCAFWDWRERMGGPGATRVWVRAGFGQMDNVHLTTAGYRLLGNTIFGDLSMAYDQFLKIRTQPEQEVSQK